MDRGRLLLLSIACGLALLVAGCSGPEPTPPPSYAQTVHPSGTVTLSPRTVNAADLRWRDVLGGLYTADFRGAFSYASQVSVTWNDSASTLSGLLSARSLKPNFAYQMKLVGRKTITNARTAPSANKDPEGWSSWQLGHYGRWWCNTCGWNVSDAELNSHVKRRHSVIGYLLYDFFVTDTSGNADKSFALNSTYHVLFRTDQQTRTSSDSAVLPWEVLRGQWGYGLSVPVSAGTAGIFAQGEPNRPAPGQVHLPAGPYSVWFNLTEESFHDNLGNTVPYGGFWAQVLETSIKFTGTGG
jgi:hypothetical protein